MRDHALNNLRYIREAMESASAFTSIPGWGGVWIGVTATVAAALAHQAAGRDWLMIWLGEALVAAILAAVTMMRKAARANVSFRDAPARRFFVSYFAPLAAGAALTLVHARGGLF